MKTPVDAKEKVMNRESATNRSTNQAWSKWIAGAALGAVAMYLSDPEKGRRRRALARDKMQRMVAKTGDAIDVTSRDLGNRIQGLRAEASRMLLMQRKQPTDDQLVVERVRSKIGRAVSHPHAIKVTANQGRVTLSGPVLANEKEQLLEAVRAVPGVVDVEDALEVHERPDVPSLQGQGKPRQLRPSILQENWPPALRALAAVGGGALGYYGLRRRSPASVVLAAFGFGLMARGMANMPLKRVAGIDTAKPPIHLQKTIYIEAPPETVFGLWSNYENFPHFMSTVQKVQDLGNGRSHWVVNGPAGTVVEWDAVLTESRFPEVLAWKSEPNSIVQHEGKVRFEPANGGTRVTVQMDYSPPAGVLGHAVASLFNGDPKKQMDEDLMRMKTFIESGIPPRDAAKPIRHEAQVIH
jgi:uncharacterized membrane protein/gas vesicle protein